MNRVSRQYLARVQRSVSIGLAFCFLLLVYPAAGTAAKFRPLGNLPGGSYSRTEGISGDGSVVVGYGDTAAGREAFRWTSGSGMIGLGDLPGGPFSSEPYGVSSDGSVVVGYGRSTSGNEAFLWTPAVGMVRLQDFLVNDLGLELTGWTLKRASGTSDNGRVIAGYGINPSAGTEAWTVSFESVSLQWTGAASGNWDTLASWSYGLRPGAADQDDVFIRPVNGLTVTGPSSPTTIASLTIGAQTNGTATLKVEQSGTLTVTGGVIVEGRGKIAGDGMLLATGGITNNGQIDLSGASLQLAGGALTNNGTVRGSGQVDNTLANATDGQVWGNLDRVLTFSGWDNTNAGEINLNGGDIVFAHDLTNDSDGFIGGRGVLDVEGGLANHGTMAFGSGLAEVYGDVTNHGTGVIVTSGGGTTVFYDDVFDEGGQLRISRDSSAVIFGSYNGGSTGSGTLYAEGDLRPGNSPGTVSFGGDVVLGSQATVQIEIAGTTPGAEHDQLNVAGTLVLSGTLKLDLLAPFVPARGDSFTVATGAASISDRFGAVDDTGAVLGVASSGWQLDWLIDDEHAGRIELLVGVRGDMDFDGDVDFDDIDDFVLGLKDPAEFLLALGHGAAAAGDGDGDGDLDFDDIEGFVGRLVGGAPIGAGSDPHAAPEPPTLLLLGLGAVAALVFSQQRRRNRIVEPQGHWSAGSVGLVRRGRV